MAQDTDDLQHGHLYEIARQAQKKAVRARRRNMKRAASTLQRSCHVHDPWSEPVQERAGMSDKQRHGMRGEDEAAHYLQNQGLRILARNIHCRTGEIDLIATDGISLIFVEVRLRASRRFGGAAASVNTAKQRRLIRAAYYVLPQLRARYFAGAQPHCRFDVISIDNQELTWIKHAFDHSAWQHL